jgi:hypothetical protein
VSGTARNEPGSAPQQDSPGGAGSSPSAAAKPPLISIKGDASPEEVAAVVAVFQALASAAASAAPAAERRSQWSTPTRMHRRPLQPGPDGWRASGLPR